MQNYNIHDFMENAQYLWGKKNRKNKHQSEANLFEFLLKKTGKMNKII